MPHAVLFCLPPSTLAWHAYYQGFDVRGDCKVFDLGLCKSLTPELKAKDGGYGYRLTGRAGSLPYMAVEVSGLVKS
jgi:hypothetical protein